MATFTYYGSDVLNGTISTASTATVNTGGAETSKTTTVSGGNHFCEVYSQGGTIVASASITAPTGHGWVTASPGAGTFATGNWSASFTAAFAAVNTGNLLTVRFYRYSSGTYTSIGTINSATITVTTKTTYAFSATSMTTITFAAGDLVYYDLWLTDTTGAGGDGPVVYESTSATAGVASDAQITTSTFTPSVTTNSRTVPATIALLQTSSRTVPATVALQATNSRTVPATIALLKTNSRTVPATAALANTFSRTVPATIALDQPSSRTVPATIALLQTNSRTVPATVALQATNPRTVPATVALLLTQGRTVPATVALTHTSTRTVPATIALSGTLSRTVPANIALTTTRSRTVPAGIALTTTNSRTVPATIALTIELSGGGFGVFASGPNTASFDHVRFTQYPDPALSLAPIIPRLGTSLVQWNALTPTNTTLGIDLSTDGVNWTDVSALNGQAFPQYFVQPDPTIDGFASNTSANYTSTFRTGGAALTATFDTANSRLALTGGINAICVNSSITRADVDFYADLDRSDAGGLVWRYVDANNFYYLLISDNLASSGTPNTITLYRVASNVQTQLAQSTIVCYRGIHYRFRVTMLGSVITASMDGAQMINYTDGSPIPSAGNLGLFNNGGTVGSRYSLLWIQPQGDLVTGSPTGDIVTGGFVYTRARLSTTDPTATPQIQDLTTLAAGPNIRNGVSLANIIYNAAYIGKTYDDLAKTSNYSWYIGVDTNGVKTLYFRQNAAVPSPWILQSNALGLGSDLEQDTNLVVETANNTLYRNRQILLNVIATGTFSDAFIGDAKATSFTLRYPLASGFAPTITRNGIAQTVGLKGTVGSQWYYAAGDPVIAQDTNGVVLQASDTLAATNYQGTFLTNLTVDNVPAQLALKAIQGGTGIVEETEDVSSKQLNIAAATTYAQQLLARNGIPGGKTVTFKTYRSGLDVLQTLTAFVLEENMYDSQLLITDITITMQTSQLNGVTTPLYGFVVIASELPYIASWPALMANNLLNG